MILVAMLVRLMWTQEGGMRMMSVVVNACLNAEDVVRLEHLSDAGQILWQNEESARIDVAKEEGVVRLESADRVEVTH